MKIGSQFNDFTQQAFSRATDALNAVLGSVATVSGSIRPVCETGRHFRHSCELAGLRGSTAVSVRARVQWDT